MNEIAEVGEMTDASNAAFPSGPVWRRVSLVCLVINVAFSLGMANGAFWWGYTLGAWGFGFAALGWGVALLARIGDGRC